MLLARGLVSSQIKKQLCLVFKLSSTPTWKLISETGNYPDKAHPWNLL